MNILNWIKRKICRHEWKTGMKPDIACKICSTVNGVVHIKCIRCGETETGLLIPIMVEAI